MRHYGQVFDSVYKLDDNLGKQALILLASFTEGIVQNIDRYGVRVLAHQALNLRSPDRTPARSVANLTPERRVLPRPAPPQEHIPRYVVRVSCGHFAADTSNIHLSRIRPF